MLECEGFSGAECWRLNGSQGQSAGGGRVLRGRVLEDEGFPGAECWRMKVLKGIVLECEGFSRAECWSVKGSQGQSAGG